MNSADTKDVVRRVLPPPVRRGLKRVRSSGYFRVRSAVELAAQKRAYRSRYGPNVIYTVHPRDEMYGFIREFWSWPFHVRNMRDPSEAMRTYLVSGEENLRDLESITRDQGRELTQVESLLEFACGFGRFTRFAVARLGASRVHVADISHEGVDFVRSTFGVDGFYSTDLPDQLEHDRTYDVVFVASLFSHLGISYWTDWLERLYDLVAPGGLLVFSTHGPYARDVVFGPSYADDLQVCDDGFSFLFTNETHGRLEEEYYGSTFVTQDFVRRQVSARGLGSVRAVYPAKLWNTQDVYVIERPAP